MANLPRLGLHCPQCAEPNNHGLTCGECLKHPPAFDRVICPFVLKGPLIGLLKAIKRSPKSLGAQQLETHLIEQLSPYRFDAILGVPYHWRKHLWRGHSPTQLLAQRLSKRLNIPMLAGLTRTKNTKSQQGLDKPRRQQNMRRAFHFEPSQADSIKQKNLLMIDDVVTTGATCHGAALVLKKHGAKSITVACLARTPLDI